MADTWLLKSEPDDYSYEDLEKDGRAVWDGVANNLALKHIRQMKPGDEALFYHTGKERAIVGVARVESEPYPDPEADDESLLVFDVSPVRRFARSVTLSEIKESSEFDDWELVRIPRLSVMPVPKEARAWILDQAEE